MQTPKMCGIKNRLRRTKRKRAYNHKARLGKGYSWQPVARGKNPHRAPLVFHDTQGWVAQFKNGARVLLLDADKKVVIDSITSRAIRQTVCNGNGR